MRVGLLLIAVVIIFVVISVIPMGPLFRGPSPGDADLSEKVEKLQEELRQKELALSVQEKHLKEMRETPTLAAIGSNLPAESRHASSKPGSSSDSEGPLMSLQSPLKSEGGLSNPPDQGEDEIAGKPGGFQQQATDRRGSSSDTNEAAAGSPSRSSRVPGKQIDIGFDAQEVNAVADSPNSGTLSFRLVKDSPDVRFSGYLFVFVEMADQRGENKIYAYPKQTRLGEEDLPADYRDGETVSFKYNSRVELPYGDIRPGASLAKVSIVLYSDNGKIVFQRGFDRREVKVVGAKEPAVQPGTRPRAGVEKRRAL